MIKSNPGERNPLTENYLALLLCIVRKYTPDQSLIMLGTGHHYNTTEARQVSLARRKSGVYQSDDTTRRPPAWATLASMYG